MIDPTGRMGRLPPEAFLTREYLVINTDALKPDEATDIVIAAAQRH
jgi:hypothetical protein